MIKYVIVAPPEAPYQSFIKDGLKIRDPREWAVASSSGDLDRLVGLSDAICFFLWMRPTPYMSYETRELLSRANALFRRVIVVTDW